MFSHDTLTGLREHLLPISCTVHYCCAASVKPWAMKPCQPSLSQAITISRFWNHVRSYEQIDLLFVNFRDLRKGSLGWEERLKATSRGRQRILL